MPFCQDAVGILGVALGVKAVADGQITSEVVRWTARFLRASYDMERAEDWHRCLFAAADQQLGSPQNLSVPPSAAVADTVESIATNPECYPRVSGTIRKCRVPRFPYGVLYRFDGRRVDILVVMHLHRQPGFWKKRLKSGDADE